MSYLYFPREISNQTQIILITVKQSYNQSTILLYPYCIDYIYDKVSGSPVVNGKC